MLVFVCPFTAVGAGLPTSKRGLFRCKLRQTPAAPPAPTPSPAPVPTTQPRPNPPKPTNPQTSQPRPPRTRPHVQSRHHRLLLHARRHHHNRQPLVGIELPHTAADVEPSEAKPICLEGGVGVGGAVSSVGRRLVPRPPSSSLCTGMCRLGAKLWGLARTREVTRKKVPLPRAEPAPYSQAKPSQAEPSRAEPSHNTKSD